MSQKTIALSGAASDVLFALFTRGALATGDLPSKSGASELRDAGLAETRSVAAKRKDNEHFTFLTAEGQRFAIQHLVETDFGRKTINYQSLISLSISVDLEPPEQLSQLFQKAISERLNKELQPGGLLHKR